MVFSFQDLKVQGQNNRAQIATLTEEKYRLNRTLAEYGISQRSRPNPLSDGPTKQYCLTNDCYTPTEFVLFGLGICILGVMIGVVAVAWFKNLCLDKDEYEDTPR